jgi:DNA-binding response OmpR family regulator
MLQKIFHREPSQQDMLRLPGIVLVIDTDPLDLDTYSYVLRSAGHEVIPCTSYQGAIRQLMTKRFDLVVVDQGGANFEGRIVLELLSTLRMHVPTIVLGRQRSMGCYLRAMGLGASHYFEKPVSTNEIKRVVATLILPRVLTGTR